MNDIDNEPISSIENDCLECKKIRKQSKYILSAIHLRTLPENSNDFLFYNSIQDYIIIVETLLTKMFAERFKLLRIEFDN
ncbi:MAG: hypothetical protein KGZ37_09240 [Nitrosarchaeum sp.]|nr:hypothetical protein [Nitrosarchaeum sp.]